MDTWLDLRSDTVTRPTAAMRQAMAHAQVGDDVFADDPTINALQDKVAALLGKEAGLFLPSGTQSNLVALMTHCQRGDEYIVGQKAHTYLYEGGGAAVLGSIQPQPLSVQPDGTLDLDEVERWIKPKDAHFANTRLLCLENTIGGRPLPPGYPASARELVDRHDLGLHLDGARLMNAAVAQGVSAEALCAPFDTVSLCLSKGLGAPVGSVLVGSRDFIERAHKWRKMLGGGMRQAGVLAAAAIHALDHHVERLADDHRRAAWLADALGELPGIEIVDQQTNHVFFRSARVPGQELQARLLERGVRILGGDVTRLVTHLDVDDAAAERFVAEMAELLPA